MSSKILRAAIAALVVPAIAFSSTMSCSSSSPSSAADAGPIDTGVDAGSADACVAFSAGPAPSPSVTIKKSDVDTIISISCAFSSCHGATNTPSKLYLPKPMPTSAWATNVINVPSNELPSMMLVKPGDPDNSWLIQKITGGECTFTGCTDGSCGVQMPQLSTPLVAADMTTMIEWVRQGAVTE